MAQQQLQQKRFERELMLDFKQVITAILALIIKVVTVVVNTKMSVEQLITSMSVLLPKNMSKQLTNPKSTTILTPFIVEQVNDTLCQGIKLNKGLYTQCQNAKKKNGGGSDFCSSCDKEHKCGTVQDRIDDYEKTGSYYTYTVDGKTPKPYVDTLDGTTKEEVEALLGIDIPDEHFTYMANNTATITKKTKKNTIPANNLIASLPATANNDDFVDTFDVPPTVVIDQKKPKKAPKMKAPPVPEPEPEESDEPVATNKTKKIGKITYKVYTFNGAELYCNESEATKSLYSQDGKTLTEEYADYGGKWVKVE
jgi:uncharacterized protein YcfL